MNTSLSTYYDIEDAINIERYLEPGKYEIRFHLDNALSNQDITFIEQSLIDSGIEINKVYQGQQNSLPYLGVNYTKSVPDNTKTGFLPVAIIPLIAMFGILGIAGVSIFKIGDISSSIVKILLVGGGILVVSLALMKKPIENISSVAARKYLS